MQPHFAEHAICSDTFLMPDPNSEDGTSKTAMKWLMRAVGAVLVATLIYKFFQSGQFTWASAWDALKTAFGLAFGAYIVGVLVLAVLAGALGAASSYKNPLIQGSSFVLAAFILIAFFDGALAGGTFLIDPALTILLGGDWSETYWGCRDFWRVADQGSFCGRDFR